ncbi:MAG: hypothetical protein WBF77_03525 [Sulfurimonadaceae bacterium]
MQISSVSDFERFALKTKKSIATKVKRAEDDASLYALQKEEAALREIELWRELSRKEWKQELYAREQQGERAVADEVNRQWSAFKKERKTALKEALKARLQQEFPAMAACFVAWVSHNYETGTFTMAKAFMASVDREQFDLRECEEEQVVFASGNLYIEYSVERIIEELGDEITQYMHFEENEWQA